MIMVALHLMVAHLHDPDHLYGYCIPSLIRQLCQFSTNVYIGILHGVGLLLNKLDQLFFIVGI